MAEPMTSNEIEDVLSSIRRLVAQDLKPGDRAKLAAVADTAQKLVLAPEQRVEDGAAKFATVRRPSRRAAFPPVDAVLANVAPLGDNGTVQRQFSLGADAAAREAEDRLEAQQAEWREIEARAAQTETAQTETAQTEPDQNLSAAQPEELAWQNSYRAHSLGEATYDDSDTYEPPHGDDFAINPAARLFDMAPNAFDGQKLDVPAEPLWQATSDTENFVEAEAEHGDGNGDDHDDEGDAPHQSLNGTLEPDVDWANAAEARVIAELAGEAVEDEVFQQTKEAFREPNFTAAPHPSPEVLFDEDVLRAMVQTIFREEMAGPMGERITRNIRKLVRAEVGRMLAAHELE